MIRFFYNNGALKKEVFYDSGQKILIKEYDESKNFISEEKFDHKEKGYTIRISLKNRIVIR